MRLSAFNAVSDFEKVLARYTGAPYCVAVNSCTSALYLCYLAWRMGYPNETTVSIPDKTYRSVAIQAVRAGLMVRFSKVRWTGIYQIKPTNIWDCALRLAPQMYKPSTFQCLSFHPLKLLSCSTGGGAILHDSPYLNKWFRWMRFDGRDEATPIQDDKIHCLGEHCHIFPCQASELHHKLNIYMARHPKSAPDLARKNYESISSKWEI
jgi:dTDP-4-amino-4,6-dideoxygalactose transaminase